MITLFFEGEEGRGKIMKHPRPILLQQILWGREEKRKKALHNKWVCSSPTYPALRGPAVKGGGWSVKSSLLYHLSWCIVQHALGGHSCPAFVRYTPWHQHPVELSGDPADACVNLQGWDSFVQECSPEPRQRARPLRCAQDMVSGEIWFWLISILVQPRYTLKELVDYFIPPTINQEAWALELWSHQCERLVLKIPG